MSEVTRADNMKLFRLVLIAAAWWSVSADNYASYIPWKKGICKYEILQMPDAFDPDKFFTGTWHMERSFGGLFSDIYRKCISVECSIAGNTVNSTLHEYIPVMFTKVRSDFQVILEDRNVPSFSAEVPFLGFIRIKIPVVVIGTDYTKFGVLYSCTQSAILKEYISEMSFVMRRDAEDEPLERTLKEVLWRSGLQWEDYIVQSRDNCPPLD